jgi:beta-mannosidase
MERVELPEASLYDDHVYYEMEEGGSWISGGSVLFCPPKYYHFQNPELTCQIQGDTITIRAAAYAKDVEIRNEEENLVLSDNYFDMEPGERTVKILRGNPTGIRLRSTYDIR